MKQNKGGTSVGRELDRSIYHNQSSVHRITDVSRLLDSPEQMNKVRLMRELQWDKGITRTETLMGNERERSDLMKELDHNSVSKLSEIREIAVTYGLKFLPAKKFLCPEKHEIELASLIVEFLTTKNISQTDYSKESFYVLADEKYFIKQQTSIDDEIGVFVFYHPPKAGDNYLRVDQIGDGELTLWRYLKGWRRREPLNGIFHTSVVTFFGSLPVFSLMTTSFIKAFFLSLLSAGAAAALFIRGMRQRGGFTSLTWNKEPIQK